MRDGREKRETRAVVFAMNELGLGGVPELKMGYGTRAIRSVNQKL